jgi:hypothetical protein
MPELPPSFLVTGLPRSGTTFVGKVLSASGRVRELFEPFHPMAGIRAWPAWPCVESGQPEAERFCEVYGNFLRRPQRYRAESPITLSRSGMKVLAQKIAGHWIQNDNNRAIRAGLPPEGRWCVKDPHLCLMPGFLQEVLGVPTLVLRRHPGAVLASWKRLGWDPDYTRIFQNPRLRKRLAHLPLDTWSAGSRLERVAGFFIATRLLEDEAIGGPSAPLVVPHEELALTPEIVFRRIFEHLQLPLEKAVEDAIRDMTSGEVTVPNGTEAHHLRRDSRNLPDAWRDHLDADETERLRDLVTRHLGEGVWT